MEISEYRAQLDAIDRVILQKFAERMRIAEAIGRKKAEKGLPVFDPAREKEILDRIAQEAPEDAAAESRALYQCIFGLSRARQEKLFAGETQAKEGAMKILVLNGPNLNMLGIREPGIYGKETYDDLVARTRQAAEEMGVAAEFRQSNHEGDLVDWIQEARGRFDGIVINPGAYTHTSVALLDAVKAAEVPTVEVHISDVSTREDFRQVSFVRAACVATVMGQGIPGYAEAIRILKERQ